MGDRAALVGAAVGFVAIAAYLVVLLVAEIRAARRPRRWRRR